MLTSTLEDYLELIHNSIVKNKEIKAVDIANSFNISRPSVSEALARLADMDLIVYKGRQGIQITQKGLECATKTAKKHQILSDFFIKILNTDKKIAEKNACKIEHVIDDELIEKIKKYTESHANNNE